jgi:hypothetical protein
MLDCFSLEYAHKKLFLGGSESVSPMTLAIEDASEEKHVVIPLEEADELQAFITAHMATHLCSLAFMEYPTCDDRRVSIRQTMKEFDSMNTDNKNHQISRRAALRSLATLPIMTLVQASDQMSFRSLLASLEN